jgi:para-aminobenzoate synthetase component 1
MEAVRRGPYCGLIGFFGSHGWTDTSVAIRVVYVDAQRLYLHAGGGIVADSDPVAEGEELQLKLEVLLTVLDSFNVLVPLRKAIDAVDDRLFEALADRFRIVGEIAELKRQHGIPSLQSARVSSMIAAREPAVRNAGTMPPELVRDFYELLVRYAMAAQDQETDSV